MKRTETSNPADRESLLRIAAKPNGAKTICVFILLLFTSPLYGQKYLEIADKSKSKDFKKIADEAEAYYRSIGADTTDDNGEEYDIFHRWKYLNERRLSNNGKLQNFAARNFEEINRYNNQRRGMKIDAATTSGNWTSLGPTSRQRTPTGYNGGLGRVNCVTVDPANSSIIYIGAPAGGIWQSSVGGNSWTPLSDGLTTLGVSGIAIDPTSSTTSRTIYILTGDGDGGDTYSIGVLKSTDGGASWLSTGLSWSVTNYIRGYKLLIHPGSNLTLFAATSNGLYKTTNGGTSWTNVLSASIADIEFKPGTPSVIYASTTGGTVYTSTNTGTSWTTINPGGTGSRIALAVTPANANYLYVLYAGVPSAGHYNGLYRSTDGGATFSLRSNTPNVYDYTGSGSANQSGYDLAMAVSPVNADEVHVGGINCWKATDGGVTFTQTSYWYEPTAPAGHYTHADIHALEFFGSTLYCGSDGGIFKSTDNASNWTEISAGLAITEMYRIGVDRMTPSRIAFGAQDNGLNYLQGNLASHWLGADGFESAIDFTNSSVIYGMQQYGGFFRTDDNGLTDVGITPPAAGGGNWLTPFIMDPNNSQTLYAGYTDLFKTTDKGATWTNISNGLTGSGACDHITIAPSNTSYIYASKYSTIYRTTNGGTSWSNISTGLPGQFITYFAVHPNDPNTIWLTVGGYNSGQKVYISTNGGTSWTNISGTLPNIPANTIVATGSNNGLYVGMDVGIYYRDNSLSDWIPFKAGLPNVIIKELEINPTSFKIIAGSFGRGAWQSDLYASCGSNYSLSGTESGTQKFMSADSIVSVAQTTGISNVEYVAADHIRLKPGFSSAGIFRGVISPCSGTARQGLSGTYAGAMDPAANSTGTADEAVSESNLTVLPNPFSASTGIQFTISDDMPVSLSIYDLTGHEIARLIKDQYFSSGTYTIPFNGTNLESGVYLCVLKTKDRSETTRIVVSR